MWGDIWILGSSLWYGFLCIINSGLSPSPDLLEVSNFRCLFLHDKNPLESFDPKNEPQYVPSFHKQVLKSCDGIIKWKETTINPDHLNNKKVDENSVLCRLEKEPETNTNQIRKTDISETPLFVNLADNEQNLEFSGLYYNCDLNLESSEDLLIQSTSIICSTCNNTRFIIQSSCTLVISVSQGYILTSIETRPNEDREDIQFESKNNDDLLLTLCLILALLCLLSIREYTKVYSPNTYNDGVTSTTNVSTNLVTRIGTLITWIWTTTCSCPVWILTTCSCPIVNLSACLVSATRSLSACLVMAIRNQSKCFLAAITNVCTFTQCILSNLPEAVYSSLVNSPTRVFYNWIKNLFVYVRTTISRQWDRLHHNIRIRLDHIIETYNYMNGHQNDHDQSSHSDHDQNMREGGGPCGDGNTLRDIKVARRRADGGKRVKETKPFKNKRLQKGAFSKLSGYSPRLEGSTETKTRLQQELQDRREIRVFNLQHSLIQPEKEPITDKGVSKERCDYQPRSTKFPRPILKKTQDYK